MKKVSFFVIMLLFDSILLFSQVSINADGNAPHVSAMLDVSSTTLGFLLPRMTISEFQTILNPAKGLLIYCADDNHFYVNRGTPASPFWAMVNTEWGINGSHIYFLGSNVGIGTSNPTAKLDLRGNTPDDGVALQIGNSDLSHSLLLFGGRQNDPNPFIRWKQGDPLRFMTDEGGGSEKMRITNNGQVGIGTSTPSANIHVTETNPGFTALFGSPICSWNSSTNVNIGDDNGPASLYIGQSIGRKGFIYWDYNPSPGDATFNIGTVGGYNNLILCHTGGNVGIGTTTPESLLDIQYNLNSYSQLGYNLAVGSFFYHSEDYNDGDGQTAVYAYRTRDGDFPNDGTDYGVASSNAAIKGLSWWGDQYSFGTAGFNVNDYTRCGGILGAEYIGDYWGSLGYKNSSSTGYGGYFSSYTSGSGKSSQPAYIGIGMGAWGDLLGADIHGKVYGIYAEGGNYAMFSNGPVYKNNLDVHLQENGIGTNTALYTYVSTDVCVQTSGIATLSSGMASIVFDPAFSASVSSEVPVVVTVTPTGKSNGVYLSEVSRNGFTVVENDDGKSTVTINYIAIGRRAGYENPSLPPEVIDAGYTSKMARGLHNDADTQTNGEGLYYENGHLVVGVHPSTLPDPNKPAEKTVIPRPTKAPKRVLKDDDKGLIGD